MRAHLLSALFDRVPAGPVLVGAAALLCATLPARSALAQCTPTTCVGDVKIRMPNVLLVVDSSYDMRLAPTGEWADCTDDPSDDDGDGYDDGGRSRWVMLAEALTGTVEDLECNSSSTTWRIRSNDCYPTNNSHSDITGGSAGGLSTNNRFWPVRNGNPKDRDPVKFVDGGTNCRYHGGSNDWRQSNDGVIDTFSDRIRFGVVTFDGMSRPNDIYPFEPAQQPTYAAALQTRTNQTCHTACGGTCSTSTSSCNRNSYQSSYWFQSAANNWTSGAPPYGGNLFMPSPNMTTTGTECTLAPGVGFDCPQSAFDVGVKNPRTHPWRGRMVGFGDPDANAADTLLHNGMVELVILGNSRWLANGAPLGAAMRDVHEFILNDFGPSGTTGVAKPHPYNQAGQIIPLGPRNDSYFNTGCREQHVIVITQGEPHGDLKTETMGYWAEQLYNDTDALGPPVVTRVMSVGPTQARWHDPSLVFPASRLTQCASLTDADFAANRMCEPSAQGWRFADTTGSNGTGANGTAESPNGVLGGDDTLTNYERSAVRSCCNVLDAAIKGDDQSVSPPAGKPYFAGDVAALKTALNDSLQRIGGGSVSRTQPVFTGKRSILSTATHSFAEFRSSLEVPATGAGLWLGHLERVRYECSSGLSGPVAADNTEGDILEENLNENVVSERRFFTVSVDEDGAPSDREYVLAGGSIRTRGYAEVGGDPNNHDCLYECGSTNVGDFHRLGGDPSAGYDALVSIDDLRNEIDNADSSGSNSYYMMGLQNSDRNDCDDKTNSGGGSYSSWAPRCAEGILEWFGGHPDPWGDTYSRDPTSSEAPPAPAVVSPLGAIYRSTPVVIPPPTAEIADELFGSDTNAASFVAQQGLRPSVLYAQTVDGQLHAFVAQKNDSPTTPYGGAFTIPDDDALTQTELWTFIPPAVLPAIYPNYLSHVRLTDGPLTWANLPFRRSGGNPIEPYRTQAEIQNGDGVYRTILLASGGASALGGFYYALDVTDPTRPRFLWQLSTAGEDYDDRARLFADVVPGGALAVLRVDEGTGNGLVEMPVAILPGGAPLTSAPIGTRPRRAASTWAPSNNHDPRTTIRDWGPDQPGRTLTIVELYTGRIVMRMGGEHCPSCGGGGYSDHPRNASGASILHSRVIWKHPSASSKDHSSNVAFDSPLVSQPVVFPNGTGEVATRAYVGDADGTLWRIDFSDPDPDNWKAEIAFDAYNSDTLNDAWVDGFNSGADAPLGLAPTPTTQATMGQPIFLTPVISTDDFGQPTVAFATGDQETFQVPTTGMVNMMVSFIDEVDQSVFPARYVPRVNYGPAGQRRGIEMAFIDGGRVTGPLSLFDGQLLFAVFQPQTGLGCGFGKGGWCAVHYLEQKTDGEPLEVMDLGGGVDKCEYFEVLDVDLTNAAVFGMVVNQRPTCEESGPFATNDAWLAGNYSAMTSTQSGGYEVVFHTGQSGGDAYSPATKSQRTQMKAPRSRTRIQSWVSAIE